MSRDALLQMLTERLGLDPDALGERVVEHSLQTARETLGVQDDHALYALAQNGRFDAVSAAFLVPETWFFRAPEQFRDLVTYAQTTLRHRRPLRVLSLPCATGEEAWSAAAALLDAGLTPAQIDVLGIDIGVRFVEQAQRGRYPLGSGSRRAPQEPWFESDGTHAQPGDVLRRCVRFRVGNALDPRLFAPNERFDVVLCRNLLIYLHADARSRLLEQLCAALDPPALVLAGQAEVLSAMSPAFKPYREGSPLSFVYSGAQPEPAALEKPLSRRERSGGEGPAEHRSRKQAKPQQVASVQTPAPSSAVRAPTPGRRTESAPATAPPDPLASLRAQADAGQLTAALAGCRALLQQRPDDAPALFLLATLESAHGDLAAADAALAQVLYLDADHVDALEHRAAIARRQQRTADAQRLADRARRVRRRLGGDA